MMESFQEFLDSLPNEWGAERSTQITNGAYKQESQACDQFDAAAMRTGLFIVHREVCGSYLFTLPEKTTSGACRIDRILEPTEKLITAGWGQGMIGVELKRSDKKIGPVISQLLDYKKAAWKLPNGSLVILSYVFVYPAEKAHNEPASIMAQNRIGTGSLDYAPTSEWHRLSFFCGEQGVLAHYFNTDRTVIRNTDMGRRAGSR